MPRISSLSLGLIAIFAATSPLAAQPPFIVVNNGLYDVQVLRANAGSPGSTSNWKAIWNFVDANPGFTTGAAAGFTITENASDVETLYNYGAGNNPGGSIFNAGNGNSDLLVGSINNDGVGGGGGPVGATGDSDAAPNLANNYSLRGQTFLQFTTAGTYTIGMASDDGRRIDLTEAVAGSAPGFSGFTSFAGSNDTTSATSITEESCCNSTMGTFTVAAGDVLALDAFYFEGGGGDWGEIALAQGTQDTFDTANFQLLQDNLFGDGSVLIGNAVLQTPEPASIAIWSLLGLSLAGFGWYRVRKHKQ